MNKQLKNGIWKFAEKLPIIPTKYQLSLSEGNTSLKKINNVYFKCEYENPTGSVKDRGMAYHISVLYQKKIRKAVISSSGNAAISAAAFCKLAGIELTVFVSPKINKKKLAKLTAFNCKIIKNNKPVSSAFLYAKNNSIYNLRSSISFEATVGYQTIAYELVRQLPKIDAVFLPVSSGTTLVGLARGFFQLKFFPAIHVIQTEKIHPIASVFDKKFASQKTSLADAIVARYTPRQEEVVDIIKKTKGWAWVISDKEIRQSRKWLLKNQIDCSYEGAATVAALGKAKRNNFKYRLPVCLLTGRFY